MLPSVEVSVCWWEGSRTLVCFPARSVVEQTVALVLEASQSAAAGSGPVSSTSVVAQELKIEDASLIWDK